MIGSWNVGIRNDRFSGEVETGGGLPRGGNTDDDDNCSCAPQNRFPVPVAQMDGLVVGLPWENR